MQYQLRDSGQVGLGCLGVEVETLTKETRKGITEDGMPFWVRGGGSYVITLSEYLTFTLLPYIVKMDIIINQLMFVQKLYKTKK